MNDVVHVIVDDENEFDEFLKKESYVRFKYDDREKIENLDNFKRELERLGLMTNELDEFIANYMMFCND